MNIIGYLDKFSYKSGETVNCKVSSILNKDYKVEFLQIIQGDVHPKAPGYKVKKIKLNCFNKKVFKGRKQNLNSGSYAKINIKNKITSNNFTLSFNFFPTLIKDEAQVIFSSNDKKNYFKIYTKKNSLYLEHENSILLLSESFGFFKWNYLKLKFNKNYLYTYLKFAGKEFKTKNKFSVLKILYNYIYFGCSFNQETQQFFNGKLSGVKIIDHSKITKLLDFDFSKKIDSQSIFDTGKNKFIGKLFNHPTRGIKGPKESLDIRDWTKNPEEYDAIHFHEDDITDAKWKTDFSFMIPNNIKSAVYCLRLYTDDHNEFFIPLVILPKSNSKNKVAFLFPSVSYLAYANNRIGIDVPETELVTNRLLEINDHDLFMQENPSLGYSFYDLHNDNSGVYYSSRKRPIIDFQPKFIAKLGGKDSNVWQFNADTHILGWFDYFKQNYDVITDHDLQKYGRSIIKKYKVVVTGTHPEYYSLKMLDTLQSYINKGGRLMYLGGNGFYWRISFDKNDNSIIECRKSEDGIRAHPPKPGEYHASTTGEYTGLWRNNNRPPNLLVGVGMVSQGFDYSSSYHRTKISFEKKFEFIFKHIPKKQKFGNFGLSGHGAAGLELDSINYLLGTPENTHLLAYSKDHSDIYLLAPEEMLDPAPGLGGTENEKIQSNIVIHQNKNFGGFFSVGSIAWAGSMAWNKYDNEISKITFNVLKSFISKKKFLPEN